MPLRPSSRACARGETPRRSEMFGSAPLSSSRVTIPASPFCSAAISGVTTRRRPLRFGSAPPGTGAGSPSPHAVLRSQAAPQSPHTERAGPPQPPPEPGPDRQSAFSWPCPHLPRRRRKQRLPGGGAASVCARAGVRAIRAVDDRHMGGRKRRQQEAQGHPPGGAGARKPAFS